MRPHLRAWSWAFVLALVLSGYSLPEAKAQFYNPFYYFFNPAPQYARPYVPRRAPRVSYRRRVMYVRVAERPRRVRGPVRIRHASLSRASSAPSHVRVRGVSASPAPESFREERKVKLTPPRDLSEDPVAALLKDKTLRQGDVVVMPDGAKVFRGGANAPHRLSDFEDVRRSRLIGEKNRRFIMALPVRSFSPNIQAASTSPSPDRKEDQEQRAAVTGSLPRNAGP